MSFESTQIPRPGILSSPSSPTAFGPYKASTNTNRVLKSQQDPARHARDRRASLTPREDILGPSAGYFDHHPHRAPILPPIAPASAYLTPELLIARSTEGMRELFGVASAAELDGAASLFDLVARGDAARLQQLVAAFRAEMRERGPARWAPAPASDAALHAAAQAARTHTATLHVLRPGARAPLALRVRANLARLDAYVVVMVFAPAAGAYEPPPPHRLDMKLPPLLQNPGFAGIDHRLRDEPPPPEERPRRERIELSEMLV